MNFFIFYFFSLLLPELCLKESLCMGISSKLLLDATGTQGSELDSIYSLNDRGRKSIRDADRVRAGWCRYQKHRNCTPTTNSWNP